MPRLLPFYRTGMALSGGGGGALGDATVWPTVSDWASLGTIAGPLRVGDRATIIDLLPGYGVAQYNGSVWELVQAVFSTVADLSGFPEPIAAGATAIVGTGIETDPMYYHDGAQWLRMPDGVRYIYPQVPNWALLPSVDTIVNEDRVAVQDLGTAHSSGVASNFTHTLFVIV